MRARRGGGGAAAIPWSAVRASDSSACVALRDDVAGPARRRVSGARARRLLHEASMSLALEKFIASSADASMRACLFRWFEVAGLSGQFNNDAAIKPRAERRRLRAPPLAPTPEQTNNLDKQESRINAQEALLQRELRDIETELQHQVTGEASRRVSQSRSFDLGASVNESILAAELRHVQPDTSGLIAQCRAK